MVFPLLLCGFFPAPSLFPDCFVSYLSPSSLETFRSVDTQFVNGFMEQKKNHHMRIISLIVIPFHVVGTELPFHVCSFHDLLDWRPMQAKKDREKGGSGMCVHFALMCFCFCFKNLPSAITVHSNQQFLSFLFCLSMRSLA